MATQSDPRISEFCQRFLPKLVAAFRPSLVLAFGSRVRREALRDSDLDLLIVSEAFEAMPWLERPVRVIEDTGLSFGVDLLCYTPEEYQRKRSELGIVRTASEQGLVLSGSP